MRRQILKLVFFISFAIFLLKTNLYAATNYMISSASHNEGSTSTGASTCTSDQTYYQGLTLQDVNIKFTQDDDEYFFDITAKSSFKFLGNNLTNKAVCTPNYYDIPQPVLYKEENFGDKMYIKERSKVGFVDYAGDIYHESLLTIKNNEIAYYYSASYIKSNGDINSTGLTRRDSGDKFFIPNEARLETLATKYNYKYVKKYPYELANNNSEDGVRMIKNSSSKAFDLFNDDGNNYVDTAYITIDVKLAIDKTLIDDYRYICFICSEMAFTSYSQGTGNYLSNGYSLSTNTIDLKKYNTCSHSWSVTESGAINHTIKCANCEWVKTEAHDYKFAYDGIANDVCICSQIKQIKYHYEINDDYNTSVEKVLNTSAVCEKVEVKKKTGYNFKWYEKYELQFNETNLFNMTTNTISTTKVFLNNTTSIDNTTGSRSIFYKAVYSPIKYIFNYSNKASTKDYISKVLNKSISPQTFYYNSKDYLKESSKYDYLTFKGWTLTEGSSNIDFSSNAEIFNYTSIDLSEFTIYPIYEPMVYKILYNTISGKYEGDTQQASKTYDYYIDEDFLKPKDMGKNKTFSHYVDMYGNEFTDMNALRNYIKNDAGDDQTIILFAMSKIIDESIGNDNNDESSTPQGYWDLNNRDDNTNSGNDIDNNIKDDNTNNSGVDTPSDDKGNSDDSLNNGDTDNSINSPDTNSGFNNNVDNTSNTNSNSSVNETEDKKETNNSNNSNTNNNSISYSYYSSGGGGGGGSNNRSERIKSFPEDKYMGPGVVNAFTELIAAEAITNNLPSNVPQYLYNNIDVNKFNLKEIKNSNNDIAKNGDEDEEEDVDKSEVFGPLFIDLETMTNYRGLYGPWYYESEYIERILREREDKAKEIEMKEELRLKEEQKESRIKVIRIIIVSVLFIVFIIIFEVFNLKQMKKRD